MGREPSKEFVEFDISIHVFTVSATLVGVCMTVIGIARHLGNKRESLLEQKLLALNAFMFLICCILSYFSMKTGATQKIRRQMSSLSDSLFICGLTLMVVICGLIVYELI